MSDTSNSDSTAVGLDGLIKMSRDKDSSSGNQDNVVKSSTVTTGGERSGGRVKAGANVISKMSNTGKKKAISKPVVKKPGKK